MAGITLLLLVCCAWGLYCNHQTWRDRLALVNKIKETDPNWREKFDELNEVSYGNHLLHRFLLLNPANLYTLNK